MFHIPNTLRLLRRIHPDVPHMLSDALWFHGGQEFHHNRLAPRCLPCHYDDPLLDEEDSCPHLGFQAPRVGYFRLQNNVLGPLQSRVGMWDT